MFSWAGKTFKTCLPLNRHGRINRDEEESLGAENDALTWFKDLERHPFGDFSFAVVQAKEVLEDQSQVETGQDGTFVGVYDGHGGADTSNFICENLLRYLTRLAQETRTLNGDTIGNAFFTTEDEFLKVVMRGQEIKPALASVGSCCLVGLIRQGRLYVANLGDSRAVIGSLGRSNKIVSEQLTQDHNASVEEVRQELRSQHPDDHQVVIMKNGAWRVKGIIQVTRSIGDAYLKKPNFPVDPQSPRFRLSEPLRQAVLRADPALTTRILQPNDRFLIFASDGLWEQLSNQKAVEIVHKYPRHGIARRLIKLALIEVANKRQMRYADLKALRQGERRQFHDDITVVVIFLDNLQMPEDNDSLPGLSVRGFVDAVGESKFNILQATDMGASTSSSTA